MVYSDFLEFCFSFLLCVKKERLLQCKECSTKTHYYFVELYIPHHWKHCLCDEPNDYSDHKIWSRKFYKFARINEDVLEKNQKCNKLSD